MPKMLIDGAVEYEDGTPATEAQVIFFTVLFQMIVQASLAKASVLISYSFCNVGADGERCGDIFSMGC